MERGLLWLPLLALFIGLAWAGWNEFQKVESFRRWAEPFRHSKYDLYSVLGLDGEYLAIGKPSRQGPVEVQQVALADIQAVQLWLDDQPEPLESPEQVAVLAGRSPRTQAIALELTPQGGVARGDDTLQIRFTQLDLAIDWTLRLKRELLQRDD